VRTLARNETHAHARAYHETVDIGGLSQSVTIACHGNYGSPIDNPGHQDA